MVPLAVNRTLSCNIEHEVSIASVNLFNCIESARFNISNTIADSGTDRAKLGQIFTATGTSIHALWLFPYNNTNVPHHPTQVSVALYMVDANAMMPKWTNRIHSITIPYTIWAPTSYGQWTSIPGFEVSGLTVNEKYAFIVEGVDSNEGGPAWGGLSARCTYLSHGNDYEGGCLLDYDASKNKWGAWCGFDLNFILEMGFGVFNVFQDTGHDAFGLGQVFTSVGTCISSIKLQTYDRIDFTDPGYVVLALYDVQAPSGLPNVNQQPIQRLVMNYSQWLAPSFRTWIELDFNASGLQPGRQYALIFYGDNQQSFVSACKSVKVNHNYMGGYMLISHSMGAWDKMADYDLNFQIAMNYEMAAPGAWDGTTMVFMIILITGLAIAMVLAMNIAIKRSAEKKRFKEKLLKEKQRFFNRS